MAKRKKRATATKPKPKTKAKPRREQMEKLKDAFGNPPSGGGDGGDAALPMPGEPVEQAAPEVLPESLPEPAQDGLTPEQEKQLVEFRRKWLAIGLCTDPADRPRFERAVTEMYAIAEITPPPTFTWHDGPYQACEKEPELDRTAYFYGQAEVHWIAFYLFPRDFLGYKCDPEISRRFDLWADVAQSAYIWWPLDGRVVVCERPEHIVTEPAGEHDRVRPHCADGPAIRFRDSVEHFYWHGIPVSRRIIMEADTITVEEIDEASNAEQRRVLVERYGEERYITDKGAKPVQQDDWGQLFRVEQPGDEPLVFVRVVNSTAEPDGTFRIYMLSVPPTVRTAREGIAWTFDLGKPENYNPAIQT